MYNNIGGGSRSFAAFLSHTSKYASNSHCHFMDTNQVKFESKLLPKLYQYSLWELPNEICFRPCQMLVCSAHLREFNSTITSVYEKSGMLRIVLKPSKQKRAGLRFVMPFIKNYTRQIYVCSACICQIKSMEILVFEKFGVQCIVRKVSVKRRVGWRFCNVISTNT